MKIWISYLLDQLQPFGPHHSLDNDGHVAPKVNGIYPYFSGMGPLREQALYLCLEAIPTAAAPIPPDSYFIVSSSVKVDHLPNLITLDDPPEQQALLTTLLDAAERYQAWIDELVRLSLEKADPQVFCDAGSQLLINPILIQSASFSLISISKDASLEDYPFFDFGGTLRPIPEYLFRMSREMKVLYHCEFENGHRCSVVEVDGGQQVRYNLTSGGIVCAHIVLPVTRAKLTPGMLDLLHDFCRYLRYILNVPSLQPVPGGMANFALEQLLQFGSPKALEQILCPREDWSFLSAILELEQEGAVPIAEHLLQIQDILPNSAACIYNDRICVLLCISDKDSDATYSEYQFQRLQSLAEAADGIFGVSYPMNSLLSLKYALHQSTRTLELPRMDTARDPAHDRLRFYGAVAMTDILSSFFSDNAFEHYLPPEIAALYHSDLRHDHNNCEILYYYLLNGKSLASASEALHMHRSTIVYRLERMKEAFHLRLDVPQLVQLYLLCCQSCLLRKQQRSSPPSSAAKKKD